MNHRADLKFKTSAKHISMVCPKCGMIAPFNEISCKLSIKIAEAAEPHQPRAWLNNAFLYELTDDPETIFMGVKCPDCDKIMMLIDSDVAKATAVFNKLKIFTKFSCEGHYHPNFDPVTEYSTPGYESAYVSFCGTGKIIEDILYYILVTKNGFTPVSLRESEFIIPIPEDHEYAILNALMIDTRAPTLYMRSLTDRSQKAFDEAQAKFVAALNFISEKLPEWIRDWYDNSMEYHSDKAKPELKQAWDEGWTLEDTIKNLPCDKEEVDEDEC